MLSWMLTGRASHGPPSTIASTARDAQLATERAVMPIESRIDSLELACAGLWELLKTKHGYTDEELVAAVREVDARDGAIDGRMKPAAREGCPHCKRLLLTKKSLRCNWCGGELGRSPL